MSNLDLSTLLRVKRTAPPPLGATTPEVERDLPRVANASLDTRCEILRFNTTQDEFGGASESWIQAGSYPCRVEDLRSGDETTGEGTGLQSTVPYRVYLPRDAHVIAADRIGVPGWFNEWRPNQIYQSGTRVILPEFDGFFYEATSLAGAGEFPGVSPKWYRVDRAHFFNIEFVIAADSNNDLLIANCTDVRGESA